MSETPDAPAAESGPLTREAAVQMLISQEAPQEAAPEEPEQPEPEASPEAEAAPEPEEAIEDESEEPSEPEAPAIAAPHSWDAEAKALWSTLTPEAQAVIADREKARDTATAKALQEATEARKRAEAEAGALNQLKTKLDEIVPEAEAAFKAKWPEKIDWVTTLNQCVEQYGLEDGQRQFLLLKEQHEADTQQIAAAKAAQQEAENKSFQTFVQTEIEKLQTVEPELVDPQHGPERWKRLNAFLVERGIPADQLRNAGAIEYSLAYDAMRWRESQKVAKAALSPPKPVPAPAKPAVKPAAAQPGNAPQREAQKLANRFAQTRSRDDAVALILAKGL